MRQASVSKETLKVYSTRLCGEAGGCARTLAEIESAIISIAERPRYEGETAFPALGNILDAAHWERTRSVLLKCQEEMEQSRIEGANLELQGEK